MFRKSIDRLSENEIETMVSDFSEHNENITETAGFVPLEVKLRRFQENGQIMQFSQSEFTSSDLRELYLSPDLEITPEMDIEEIQEVQIKRQEYINQIKKAQSDGQNVQAGTEEPEKKSAEAAETVEEKE